MSKSNRGQPPAEGVTPELFEIVSKWLRTTYGSRPLDHMIIYYLENHLGDLERQYVKERKKPAAAVDGSDDPPASTLLRRAGCNGSQP